MSDRGGLRTWRTYVELAGVRSRERVITTMAKSSAGDLLAIPLEAGTGLAKVIFASSYFKDVILLKLYKTRLSDGRAPQPPDFGGDFDLYYTAQDPVRKGRWRIVGSEAVSATEVALTKRTSGGEVFIEDRHLGPASTTDFAELPAMLVHGFKLVEKYAARFPT